MAYYRVTFGNREAIVECDQPMSYVGEIYKDRLIGECDEYGNLRVPYISPETEAALEKAVQEFVSKHPQFIKDTQTPEQLAKLSEPTQEANNVVGFDEQLSNLVNFFGKEWYGGLTGTQYQLKKSTTEEDTVANPQPVEETTMKQERFTPVTSIESIEYYIQLVIEVTAELIPLTVTGVQGMLDIALKEPFTLPPTFNTKFYSEYYVDQAAYGRNVALYNLIMKTIELREDIQHHECEETSADWGSVLNPHVPNEFPPTRLDTRVSQSAANHECRKVVISALNDWKRRVDARHAYHSDQTQERTHLQEVQFKHIKRYAKDVVKSVLENTDDILVHIDVAEQNSFGFITGSADGKTHTRHFTVKFHEKNWIIVED